MSTVSLLSSEIKKSKSRENGDSLQDELACMIEENKVLLFMKGNRLMPQCGFSAHVIGLLEQHQADYVTFDILQDTEVRQGLKEYSNWPTYPQLYVGGKFVGGCDIVNELEEDGELADVLNS